MSASPNISRLHPKLRTIARNIPRAAAAIGFRARVTSGYRDPRKQAWLYNQYLQGLTPYVVAPPGSSLHEKGLAIDVVSDDTDSLVTLLTSAGLSWAGPSDPVHFTMIGAPARSQGRSIGARASWAQGPGASIPTWATHLPFVGKVFSTLKDPTGEAKYQSSKLIDVILGFL